MPTSPARWAARVAVVLFLPFALLAAALSVGRARGDETNLRPNVILVCMDTVRADHLGVYGHERNPTTPFLDRLAEESIVFKDASATAGWTKPSVPSFLTGTYPCQHGVYEGSGRLEAGRVTDVLPKEALTLAEVFRACGYRTAAFVENAQLRPGLGFEQGFEVYRDQAGDARSIRWSGLDWIDGLVGEVPFFLYLHLFDAHWPYPVPSRYAELFTSAESIQGFQGADYRTLRDGINHGEVPFEEQDRQALEDLYDGAIRYIDHELALLMRALEARGLADDTILCIVSDHGEEFGEHGRIGHGHGLWENLLHVPWILRVPGLQPRLVEESVSLVDLFPTLLSAAHRPIPDGLPGVDRLTRPAATSPIFAEHKTASRYMQSLRLEDEKLIRTFHHEEGAAGGSSFPVHVGERWEAELERDPDGGFFVTQLKPSDGDPDDPVELKGPIQAILDDGLVLGGIEALLSEETERRLADEALDDRLILGRTVKVRGPLEGGRMQVDRIKLYALEDETSLEIRGRVGEIERDGERGVLAISGHWLRFDEHTDFKNVGSEDDRPRLAREALVPLLLAKGSSTSVDGFRLEAEWFDLQGDAGELEGRAHPIHADPLGPLLDELGCSLVQGRIYREGQELFLSEEAILDLRAIGYVD